MSVRDLIPWSRNQMTSLYGDRDTFLSLHREMMALSMLSHLAVSTR
ncbi:hypothetical protein [Mesorhizobium sp. ES1-3]